MLSVLISCRANMHWKLLWLWIFGRLCLTSWAIYLASLVDLPKALYEAADIESIIISRDKRTVPWPVPVLTFVLLSGLIGTFKCLTKPTFSLMALGTSQFDLMHLALMIYQYAFGQMIQWVHAAALTIVLAYYLSFVYYWLNKSTGKDRCHNKMKQKNFFKYLLYGIW